MKKLVITILIGIGFAYAVAKFVVYLESKEQHLQYSESPNQISVSDEAMLNKKAQSPHIEQDIVINNSPVNEDKSPTSKSMQADSPTPVIYSWKDLEGNPVVSSNAPVAGQYQEGSLKQSNSREHNLTVVDMPTPSISTNKNASKPTTKPNRYVSYSSNKRVNKHSLLENNPRACRSAVSRGYDLYYKIKTHLGNRRSGHCSEFREKRTLMARLSKQGYYCRFPFGEPLNCSK